MENWEYYSPPCQNVACPQATAKVDATKIHLPPNHLLIWKASPFSPMHYACRAPKLAL